METVSGFEEEELHSFLEANVYFFCRHKFEDDFGVPDLLAKLYEYETVQDDQAAKQNEQVDCEYVELL